MKKIFAAGLLWTIAAIASAQTFPSKPIRVVVPFGPGSGVDIHGRFFADLLGKELNTTTFVENKPGANGVIGLQAVASAPADGHTIAVVSPSFVVVPIMSKSAGYTVESFKPIAGIAKGGIGFFVRADSKYATLSDMLATAKKENTSMNIGTYAGSYQIGAAWLSLLSGAPLTNISYKSASATMTDLLGGHLDLMSADMNSMIPLVKQGKMRALAVAADRRLTDMPDVPLVSETYSGYENYVWVGLVVRTGTPKPVVDRLSSAMRNVMASSEAQEHLAKLGWESLGLDSDGMSRFIMTENQRYKEVAQKSNITPQ